MPLSQDLHLPIHVVTAAQALALVDVDGRAGSSPLPATHDLKERLFAQVSDAEFPNVPVMAAHVHLFVRADHRGKLADVAI